MVASWPDQGTLAQALAQAAETVPKPWGCGGADGNFNCNGHGTCNARGLCACAGAWSSEGNTCGLDACTAPSDRQTDPFAKATAKTEASSTEEVQSIADAKAAGITSASGSGFYPWQASGGRIWNRRRRTHATGGACSGHGSCANQQNSPYGNAQGKYEDAKSGKTMDPYICALAADCPGVPSVSQSAVNTCNGESTVCLRDLCRCAAITNENSKMKHQQWIGTIDDTCACDNGWWGTKCQSSGAMVQSSGDPQVSGNVLLRNAAGNIFPKPTTCTAHAVTGGEPLYAGQALHRGGDVQSKWIFYAGGPGVYERTQIRKLETAMGLAGPVVDRPTWEWDTHPFKLKRAAELAATVPPPLNFAVDACDVSPTPAPPPTLESSSRVPTASCAATGTRAGSAWAASRASSRRSS
jgi:hypothetical protein